MKASPASLVQPNARFLRLCLVTALIVCLFGALLLSHLDAIPKLLISDVGLIGGGVASALSCGDRALRSIGRRRRAWLFLAIAGALAAAGNLWILIVTVAGLSPSLAIAGDVAFFIGLPLSMAGLITFPSVRRRGTELARLVLDGIVIGGSVLRIVSGTVFPQLVPPGSEMSLSRFFVLLLPLFDVAVATLAGLLIVRSSRNDRPALVLVSAGFAFYAVTDLTFAVLSATHKGFGVGTILDLGWIAGYALIALAARHPAALAVQQDVEEPTEASPVMGTVVTFTLFVTASITGLIQARSGGLTIGLIGLWLVVVLAVAARQILLIIDNDTLRKGLEGMVSERTSALRDMTRRAELLLASVGDGIYGVDTQGVITFVNPAAARALGYSQTELIGQDAHAAFHADQEDGQPYPWENCYISEAIREGISTASEEDLYLRKTGQQVPVEVTASPLTNDGQVQGAVVVFRDVTQRREVDKLKNEFVSVVSHELRTPLTSIRGSLGLLAGGAVGELPASAQRMLGIALDSSERLTRLINDILDIERIESGTMPMEVATYTAADLIDAAVEQVQGIAAQAKVKIKVLDSNGRVRADADRVVQTLINLLGNAIKFSPEDSSVEVHAVPKDTMVEFRVMDNGRGIPQDKLDQIFGRFEQVDSSDARDKGGTGLGLAISRSIVERLGGRIWAEARADGGAVFIFTMPRIVEDPPVEPSGEGPRLVVCDDDPDVVRVLCELLTERGYRTVGVTDGEQAVALVSAELPAALLLDLAMPGTTGADVVSALKRGRETQDVPIVVISGLTPALDPDTAAQTDGWLVKPIDEERLARTVAAAISGHHTRGTVLMVEDDDDLASVISTLLQRRGLTVFHARTRQAALDYCAQNQPQVLILDLRLPDGSGTEVVEILRRNGQLVDVPLIVYSAADVDDRDRDGLRLGRTIFLTKGRVTPQELEDRVVDLLDLATGRLQPSIAERRS
ncbi:hypothetical protein GCM10009841_26450 [Microlunatus panaciterrae]|uniref:histidine kinase n=1 Tax=Microlunatus panaciterrae TaxID=400768 RepID=A0ABS2RIX1_9ACTN|nr:response regulator [Microlunatus panaciterrae]MBM7798472.1 PAS domain S-box-containing protein [Microlunatus panaciterrae]